MTALPLRRLTEDGIEEFRRWLEEQSSAENTRPPYGLLDAPGTSLPVDGAVDVERRVFEHKRAMTRYLEEIITRSEIVHPADDIGLWSWLALHWIESLCPVNQNGRRKPKKTYHYVFDPDHRRRYRHLIAAPYEIHRAMPEWNQLFLLKPVDVHGDLMEQAMGRLYLIRIPAVSEAIERLYFDTEKQKAKPGMLSTKRKGNFRERFVTRINQLSLTRDPMSMTGDELIAALGPEFRGWARTDSARQGT